MGHDELLALLAAGGEAYPAAREAVAHGEVWTLWDGRVSAHNLADVYECREKHTHASGIETVGLAETIGRLRSHGSEPIRLGCIGDSASTWLYQLFVEPGGRYLIACVGVRQTRPAPVGSG